MYTEKNSPKRRRITQEPECPESEMTSSKRTVTFTEALQPCDLVRSLNEQRTDVAACDVILRSSSSLTSSVNAHRCVLAASGDYFKVLFRHDTTDARVIDTVIPGASHDVIERVITFIYTGMIEISDVTVEETVRLADYLGLSKVLELCEKFMSEKLNDDNCLQFKVLSDFYSLRTLSKSVQHYILPRMSMLVRRSDTIDLPVDVVRQWLSDNQTNYAREADVLKLIQDMVASRTEMEEQMEKEKARDLLHFVEFEYLPPEVIERQVLSNADTLDWLSARPELLERVRGMVGRNEIGEGGGGGHEDDVIEAILCRGRGPGKDPQVMLYLNKDDAWRVLRQPRDGKGKGLWHGLEAMVMHDGSIYALSSRVEDKYPSGKETKSFIRMDLQTGAWFILPSPKLVTGITMLVSSTGPGPLLPRRLWAIDRRGVVERYVTSERRWICHCCVGFPESPCDTLGLLAMPKESGELYVLRSFFAGFSSFSSRRWLSILRLDTDPRGGRGSGMHWTELSRRDRTRLLNAGGDGDVHFFYYSIAPTTGLISLKDVLGHTRVQFDTTQAKWATLPRAVPRLPRFIRHIYGSVDCPSSSSSSSSSSLSSSSSSSSTSSSSTSSSSFSSSSSSRVYLIASSRIGIGNPIFVMFDSARGRFKMTHAPPYVPSGLLCHVTLPTASVALMCRQD